MRDMILVMTLAAVVTAGVAAVDEASVWYTPEGGFATDDKFAVWTTGGKQYAVGVGSDGKIAWGGNMPKDAAVRVAIEQALWARAENDKQDQKIHTIAENLDSIFNTDGITISGTDPHGQHRFYTLTFSTKLGSGSTPSLENPVMSRNIADERTIHWRKDDKFEIFGWTTDDARGQLAEKKDAPIDVLARVSKGGALHYLQWWGVDESSLAVGNGGTIGIAGWSSGAPEAAASIADVVSGAVQTGLEEYKVPVRSNSGELNYMSIGVGMFGDQTVVDNESITTNTANGAVAQGVLSVVGWQLAKQSSDVQIPHAKDGALEWAGIETFVDQYSLVKSEDGLLEIAGVSDLTTESRYYFGTDSEATLGWYALPAEVRGDNETITEGAVVESEGEDKIYTLVGWDEAKLSADVLIPRAKDGAFGWDGLESFVDGGSLGVNTAGKVEIKGSEQVKEASYMYFGTDESGGLGWHQLQEQEFADTCSNKWESLAEWIGDASVGDDDISLPNNSLDDYLAVDLGYIYATEPGGDMYLDNTAGNDSITASFDIPVNWVDNGSIERNAEAENALMIKGWSAGGNCSENLSDLLTETDSSAATERANHKILCRYDDGSGTPAMHYLPLGDVIDVPSMTGAFSYDSVNHRIRDGVVMVGRRAIRVSGVPANDGVYRVKVVLTETGANCSLEAGNGFTLPSGDTSYIPVMTLSGGKVVEDMRGAFVVPAYD